MFSLIFPKQAESILDCQYILKALSDFERQLYELLETSCNNCQSNTIALSGGLDSSIIAYFLQKKKPNAVSIIAEDFVATDLTYCQLASKKFKIPLQLIKVSTPQVLSGIEETIKILKNFNDIEIRNNVVMYLTLDAIKKEGKSKIITGDGADEIFAGYSFLKQKSEKELIHELERIQKIMHFPTQKLGMALGIRVESPFTNDKIIEFAKNIPANLLVNTHKEKRYGKWILRKVFEDKLPPQIVWREKSPMQDGAGTSGLTDLFNSIITDKIFEEKKKKIEQTEGVIIRSKESLHYYETYRKFFENPEKAHNLELQCPYCKFQVNKQTKFCRMCGAFPI